MEQRSCVLSLWITWPHSLVNFKPYSILPLIYTLTRPPHV